MKNMLTPSEQLEADEHMRRLRSEPQYAKEEALANLDMLSRFAADEAEFLRRGYGFDSEITGAQPFGVEHIATDRMREMLACLEQIRQIAAK